MSLPLDTCTCIGRLAKVPQLSAGGCFVITSFSTQKADIRDLPMNQTSAFFACFLCLKYISASGSVLALARSNGGLLSSVSGQPIHSCPTYILSFTLDARRPNARWHIVLLRPNLDAFPLNVVARRL
jgi:hypothetical protein